MKRTWNTEKVSFKYFSWQLDLTPPRTAGFSSVKKTQLLPLIACDSGGTSGGTWTPCFPVWLYCFCHNICTLTWHSHSLLMGWCQEDVTAVACAVIWRTEKEGRGGKLAEGWEERAKKWVGQKIKDKQIQKWKKDLEMGGKKGKVKMQWSSFLTICHSKPQYRPFPEPFSFTPQK